MLGGRGLQRYPRSKEEEEEEELYLSNDVGRQGARARLDDSDYI